MKSLQDAVDALHRLNCNPMKSGSGYTARCPLHEAEGSHAPSLTLTEGDKQPLVLHCHAGCNPVAILKILDVDAPKRAPRGSKAIVATYPYVAATGELLFEKVRYADKGFSYRHRPAQGGDWVWKQPELDAYPLYRLPDVQQALADRRTIFVVEGEKDADRLASAGLIATTNREGAAKPEQKAKWRSEYTAQLTGADRVILLPDNDAAGLSHMRNIASQLRGKVKDIRWLELPGLPEKGDVSDWLDAGNTLEDLKTRAKNAPDPKFENNNNKHPSLPSFSSKSITFTLINPSSKIFTLMVTPRLLEDKGEPLPKCVVAEGG